MTDKIVKSVGRVFEILELFYRERQSLSGIDVSRKLNYPHTSTLAILKSMQSLDYLLYDQSTRKFHPSASLPRLVDWVVDTVQNETAILSVMSELHNSIDETINLSRQQGGFVKILHGIESSKLLGIRVAPGAVMPLTGSHNGMVALATHTDEEVERIVLDLKKRGYPDAESIDLNDILAKVREIREKKLSCGYDVYVEGIGAICFPLTPEAGGRPFIVAIAGPTERIRSNEANIIKVAKRAINAHKTLLAYPA